MAGTNFGIIISARDAASATFARIGTSLSAVGKKASIAQKKVKAMMGAMIGGAVLVAAGAIGLGASFSLAAKAGDFEQGLARVGAISRASAEDLNLLKDAAVQAGIATQFSPTQAVEGLQNLAAQGFNAKESIELLNPALDLAAGGMIGVGEATASVSAAMKVFGLDVAQGADTAGKLLRISNLTALQASDLQQALGGVGRGAVAAGQDLTSMLIAMGLVKNTGVDASVAASSVSSATIFMAKNFKKFAALGVQLTDARGKFRRFEDIVLDTQGALSGYTNDATRAAKITQLFGRFGQTAFSAMTSQLNKGVKDLSGNVLVGADALAFLRGQLTDTSTVAAEFRDKMLDTFKGQKTLLQGSVETLQIALGESFAMVLRPIVEGTISVLNTLIRTIQNNAGFFKVLAGIVVAVSSLFLILGSVLLLVGAIILIGMIPAFVGLMVQAIATAVAMIAAYWPFYLLALLILGVITAIFIALGKKPPKFIPDIGAVSAVKGAQTGATGSAITDPSSAIFSGRSGRTFISEEEGIAASARDRRAAERAERGRIIDLNLSTRVDMDGREVARGVERRRIEEEKLGRSFG